MSGLAYSADDDCRELEERLNRRLEVYVTRADRTKSGVVSEISWNMVESILREGGHLRPGETIYGFKATNDGIKIEFAK